MNPARHTLPIALVAALLVQIGHEAVHAVTTWLVGARVVWFHLFAVHGEGATPIGSLLVSASAAVVNIAVAIACIAILSRPWLKNRPSWRLFVFYLGAFNLFTGFGYLMTNALVYSPDAAGDWNTVIAHLGGGWGVRLPILLIGAAGTLYGFLWVPRSAQRFVADPADRSERFAFGLSGLLLPYLAVSALLTTLAIWHPLGAANGILLVGLHSWFGYFAVGWGFPMAAFWLTRNLPSRNETTPISHGWSVRWLAAAFALFLVCLYFLFPVPQV